MTALLAILRVAWPYIVAAGLGGFVAGWLTHKADSIALARQKAAFEGYKAQVADANEKAEGAAREALQKQIDERRAADINNKQVMDELRQRTADAESHYAADRDAIRSLLNAASQSATTGHPVPQAGGGSGSAPAGQDGRIELVSETCAALAEEDEWNANHLNALNKQLNGQVEP